MFLFTSTYNASVQSQKDYSFLNFLKANFSLQRYFLNLNLTQNASRKIITSPSRVLCGGSFWEAEGISTGLEELCEGGNTETGKSFHNRGVELKNE